MGRPYSRGKELRKHILHLVKNGEITREQAAKDACVSERTINRWMKTANVKRPRGKGVREAEIRRLKKRHTKSVIITTINENPRVPMHLLDVSLRTIYRLRKKYAPEMQSTTFLPERNEECR